MGGYPENPIGVGDAGFRRVKTLLQRSGAVFYSCEGVNSEMYLLAVVSSGMVSDKAV